MPTPTIATFVARGLSTAPAQQQTQATWPVGSAVGTNNPTAAVNAAENSSSMTTLQFPADRGKYFMVLHLATLTRRQSLNTVSSATPHTGIVLPLPLNLKDMHTEEYREYEYGMITGGAIDVALAGNRGGWLDWTAVGLAGAIGATGQAAADALETIIGQSTVRAGTGLAGYSPNMFPTVLYKGPRFKQPKLAFKLCPNNEQESEQIRQIIRALNNAMAPTFSEYTSLLWHFPDIFYISYVPNPQYLYRFKPCVLEQMTVNYAGGDNHVGFYRSTTAPESVEIDLHFRELEYWMKGDF